MRKPHSLSLGLLSILISIGVALAEFEPYSKCATDCINTALEQGCAGESDDCICSETVDNLQAVASCIAIQCSPNELMMAAAAARNNCAAQDGGWQNGTEQMLINWGEAALSSAAPAGETI